MDRATAETILELNKPYDYAVLRSSWKRLCSEYHPDKCTATGMNSSVADEVLKDINEAFSTLKPLVENGDYINPLNESNGSGTEDSDNDDDVSLKWRYEDASLELEFAKTSAQFERAGMKFQALGDFLNASELAKRCFELANLYRHEEAKKSKNSWTDNKMPQDDISKTGRKAEAPQAGGNKNSRKSKTKSWNEEKFFKIYVVSGIIFFLLVTAIFRFDVFGLWKSNSLQQTQASSQSELSSSSMIPEGVKNKYLYTNAADMCGSNEAILIVERGRVGDWGNVNGALQRVTFGEVYFEDGRVTWVPCSDAIDYFPDLDSLFDLVAGQIQGEVNSGTEAYSDADYWSWTVDTGDEEVEIHETVQVMGQTWYVMQRGFFRSELKLRGAEGVVVVSNVPFDEPSPDNGYDFKYRKMRDFNVN